jgi:hypothetical protein
LSQAVGGKGRDVFQHAGEMLEPAVGWNHPPDHHQVELDQARW